MKNKVQALVGKSIKGFFFLRRELEEYTTESNIESIMQRVDALYERYRMKYGRDAFTAEFNILQVNQRLLRLEIVSPYPAQPKVGSVCLKTQSIGNNTILTLYTTQRRTKQSHHAVSPKALLQHLKTDLANLTQAQHAQIRQFVEQCKSQAQFVEFDYEKTEEVFTLVAYEAGKRRCALTLFI